ncbi:MAG: PepSY-associated TM helix domain-containing protein [Opitutaceae bacterium]
MTNWNLLFRRTHLYLGLLLIPWMLVYAGSTFVFNHAEHFRSLRAADPQWLPLWEKDYALAAPVGTDPGTLRITARKILADHGLSGAFNVRRQGERLNLNVQNFWYPKRLTYDIGANQLRAEQKRFAWVDLLIRLHERTGYGQGGVLNNLWALAVDVYCVTMLVWIATGLYLWWKLAVTRRWGFLALGGGLATMVALLLTV